MVQALHSPGELQSLVTLGLADRMLAEVATLDEAQALINLAEQARVYARQSKLGTSAINHATVIKVRAEQRQRTGEIAALGDNQHTRSAPTLLDLDIESSRLAEARTLRDNYSQEQLAELQQQHDADDEILSRQKLLRQANADNAKVQEERVSLLFPVYTALAALASCPLTPADFATQVLPASAYRVSDHIEALA